MARSFKYYIRKTHRYLGLVLGIQFLAWTLGGLYFSWSNLDEIHGDHFLAHPTPQSIKGQELIKVSNSLGKIRSLELRFLLGEAYYWVNDSLLVHTKSGMARDGISQTEAVQIAQAHLTGPLQIEKVELLDAVGPHHEVRGRPLPLWAIHFEHPEQLSAYVSVRDGSFQRIRHARWRLFDWFWMLHTMDYQGRDDFNNWLLRAFSVFGLITIASGFVLYGVSSLRLKRGLRGIKKPQ